MFDTLDNYLDFCNSLIIDKNTTYSFLENSSLYLYESKYYLCLNVATEDINSFKSIHYLLIEFASHMDNGNLFERKLKEYGKIICASNAINTCIKYFK